MSGIPTVGVEEELALVDRDSGLLSGTADQVIAALPALAGTFVDHELKRCQIETMTPVCADLRQLRDHLADLRAAVATAAATANCGVIAAGTHPVSSWRDHAVTATKAYRMLEEDYRRLTEEQLLFGCHVHVGVDDPDLRIAVLDRVRPWLSVLLALSANSPFWEGDDTGYASYRYLVFSRWPTFGTPEALGTWAEFQSVVGGLVESGAIDDPSRLYWTVRPSSRYPTLEFRIADVCPTADEAAMIAGLARALVMTEAAAVESGATPVEVRTEAMRVAEWQAARYGVRGPLADVLTGTEGTAVEAVHRLLHHVGAALDEAGDGRFVRSEVQRVLREGTGADRQRRAWAAGADTATLIRTMAARTAPTLPSIERPASRTGDDAADARPAVPGATAPR
jgi:carboxylate-amine ligase